MRRSKIIANPVIKIPVVDNEEQFVYQYNPSVDSIVRFGTENVEKENLSKYHPMLIQLTDVPKTFNGSFVLNNEGGYDITFDSHIDQNSKEPVPLQGKFAAVIVDKEGKIVSKTNVVFAFSSIRAILDEYYLMPNTEGKMEVTLTGRDDVYGDLSYLVYNAENAVSVKRAIHNQSGIDERFDDSEFRDLKDAPDVFTIDKDGNYTTGIEGGATIGIHIMSEFAGINKLQLINISVDANMNAIGGETDPVGISSEQLDAIEKMLIETEGISSNARKR